MAATVHLFARAGARRVRMIESFFPADQDLSLWARYGEAYGQDAFPILKENSPVRHQNQPPDGTRSLRRR